MGVCLKAMLPTQMHLNLWKISNDIQMIGSSKARLLLNGLMLQLKQSKVFGRSNVSLRFIYKFFTKICQDLLRIVFLITTCDVTQLSTRRMFL